MDGRVEGKGSEECLREGERGGEEEEREIVRFLFCKPTEA